MTRLAAISSDIDTLQSIYGGRGCRRASGYTCLTVLGRAIDRTPLRRFAGGMTARCEIAQPGGPTGDATR